MNPRELQPGEIWDDGEGYTYSLHFIEEVRKDGVWLELLSRPLTYAPASHHPNFSVTYYVKHLGHGGFIEFGSTYWEEHRWTKHGCLPGLIGKRSIKIEHENRAYP